jgi:competence protein ComEA
MRISELKTKIKYLFSLYTPHSALRIPHFNRYFSLGQQKVLFVLALFLLGILTFNFYYSPPAPLEEITKEIVIEVIGEVRNPGVYIFQHSPTLKEAIGKAGGLRESASIDPELSSIALETGTLLTVGKESPSNNIPSPLEGEGKGEGGLKRAPKGIKQDEIKIKIGTMEAHKLLVFSIPLDLNRVSMEDLCLLPGIGESLAHEIVTYRERRRGFRSVEELKNIKGIGDKKYESFKTYFIVRP